MIVHVDRVKVDSRLVSNLGSSTTPLLTSCFRCECYSWRSGGGDHGLSPECGTAAEDSCLSGEQGGLHLPAGHAAQIGRPWGARLQSELLQPARPRQGAQPAGELVPKPGRRGSVNFSSPHAHAKVLSPEVSDWCRNPGVEVLRAECNDTEPARYLRYRDSTGPRLGA